SKAKIRKKGYNEKYIQELLKNSLMLAKILGKKKHLTAQLELSKFYRKKYEELKNNNPIDAELNANKCFEWTQRAAKNGDIESQLLLSHFYQNKPSLKTDLFLN